MSVKDFPEEEACAWELSGLRYAREPSEVLLGFSESLLVRLRRLSGRSPGPSSDRTSVSGPSSRMDPKFSYLLPELDRPPRAQESAKSTVYKIAHSVRDDMDI